MAPTAARVGIGMTGVDRAGPPSDDDGGESGASTPGARRPDRASRGSSGVRRPPLPTRSEVVKGVARELAEAPDDAGVERPRLEAERLVSHVLDVDRAELATTGDREMDPGEARRLARIVARRFQGEPLQHIEGTVQFRELVLLADGRALVPRPETEQLVDRVEAWAAERSRRASETVTVARRRAEPLLGTVLDVGTGSGAIALSLVVEGIARRAVGLDVSSEALLQAAANRAAAELGEDDVEFRLVEDDVWSGVGRDERFDAIVSNPPYVSDDELEELPAQITGHEPRSALAGGTDGLDVIRTIADKAAGYLRPGGALFLEIGASQGEAVRSLLEQDPAWERVRVFEDLAGRDRFVQAGVRRGAAPDGEKVGDGSGGPDGEGTDGIEVEEGSA